MFEAVRNSINERLGAWRKKRARARALRSAAQAKWRRVVVKAVACVVVLALLLALALVVGDADYHVTLLGWLPFLMAMFAVVVAFFYLQALKRGVRFAERSDAADCERGSDVRFNVAFSNATPLFAFRIDAFFYISDLFGNVASEASTSLALGPHGESEVGFTTSFEHIGTYAAGLDRIVLSDFLGLFTAEVPNPTRRQVNVTPKLHEVTGIHFSTDAERESLRAAKAVLADSLDYAQVREYVPGDPLKTIHWKLSARTEHYQTRLYEVYTNPGVGILLDFYAPSDEAVELMGMFDAVVESGLSILRFARARGMETELRYLGRDGEQRCRASVGRDEMPRMIDEMPRMSNDPADRAGCIGMLSAQISSRFGQNNLVVCSANIDSELVSLVVEAKLRRRSPLFVAVVPAALTGRALDAYCKPLARLDGADIPYIVLSKADALGGRADMLEGRAR